MSRNSANVLGGGHSDSPSFDTTKGRWPANLALDEEAAAMLDEQSGELSSGAMRAGTARANTTGYAGPMPAETGAATIGDSGGASRFFYCAKVSSSERGDGNAHPTVKPLALMRWLATLTATPTGGTVLEPFSGSGTTLLACEQTGRTAVAIELDPRHVDVTILRWQALTGEAAIRDSDGLTFDEAKPKRKRKRKSRA